MNEEEATEFVKFVDGAWKPELTDVQKKVWYELVLPLDPKAAFTVLMRLVKTEKFRLAPPDFTTVYRRELIDTTPVHLDYPQDRDELPDWVKGWKLSRNEGDERLWPETEKASRELHEVWLATQDPKAVKRLGLCSGYEWEDAVAKYGVMPQDARIDYITRAKAMTSAQMVAAMAGGAVPSAEPAGTPG
jgi:hypothetical protein